MLRKMTSLSRILVKTALWSGLCLILYLIAKNIRMIRPIPLCGAVFPLVRPAAGNEMYLDGLAVLLFAAGILSLAFAVFLQHRIRCIQNKAKQECCRQRDYFMDTDSLTNLPNRTGFKKEMLTWVRQCQRNHQNGGAFFLDIDNFRSVNNTFGHDSGDKFLRELAKRLEKVVDGNAVIGRIGGDEFSILICGLENDAQLQDFANMILASFQEPFIMRGIVIQLSCSIGAILLNCLDCEKENKFDEILNRGEFVLQEAKRTKKGGCVVFNDNLGDRINQQLQLASALKASLQNNELFCYFQPQYSCGKKTIVGFEALARWNNAKFGMISPGRFIPMAEETGFIKELGRFMMEKAFSFAKSLEGRGIAISFNSSPLELLQANYADYMVERFDYYGLKPGSVAVEITESCLIESFDEVVKKLEVLHKHGIRIYLDDFGTGFSSLTYLKNLPINAVKVDKSFIDEIATNDVEKDIVNMIILLAHRLNLDVIAEGVETEDQIKAVKECGCDIIQGFYISRPVPQDEVTPLLDILDVC